MLSRRHNGRMQAVRVLALVLFLSPPAWAQQAEPATEPAPPPVDATKLGVSLARIQKGLRTAEAKEKTNPDGLRLEFNVQVYGKAPRIDVLNGVDLVNGAVPESAPTHQQMIDYVTPVIYRTPVMPVSAFAAWAASWLWDKSKKARCEEEIANYRALVMQGVNVSAPRCTQ